MGLSFVTLYLAHNFSKNSARHQTVSGKSARASLNELGRWRVPTLVALGLLATAVFLLPMGGILVSSLSHVQGQLSWSNVTFANWLRVLFEVDETGRAFANSMLLSAVAATLATLLGVLISYILIKTRVRGRALLELFASIPYSTPGTVVALALILQFIPPFLGVFPTLYNSLALIAIAYFVKYLSFALKTTSDAYRQINDVLAEAARVSGASWLQTMRTIWIPLMWPSIIAAWFLVFMPAMSELTMTVLLTGPGMETLGTLIFQLQEYADASGGGASVLALVVVLAIIAINATVKKLSAGRYGL